VIAISADCHRVNEPKIDPSEKRRMNEAEPSLASDDDHCTCEAEE